VTGAHAPPAAMEGSRFGIWHGKSPQPDVVRLPEAAQAAGCSNGTLGIPRTLSEKLLAGCLLNMTACNATYEQLQAAAAALPSMRLLKSTQPACLMLHSNTTLEECRQLAILDPTSLSAVPCLGKDGCGLDVSEVPIAHRDLEERFRSCAVVAPHAAGLLAGQGTGPSIDAHEAVIRFDGKGENGGMSDSVESAEAIGVATALRFVSREFAQELANGQVAEETLAVSHLVVWDATAWPLLPSVHARYPEASLYIPSVALTRWQAAVMHQMRADLVRLGLGPFACNSPDGNGLLLGEAMQGVLLASLLCPFVDTYGLRPIAAIRVGLDTAKAPLQAAALNLLFLASTADICSA
ncbi:hypothetical protein WJX84_006908, partial [Apatococcus fuscideae]